MNVSLPDATAYNSKQLAIQKDMTPSLYAMFFKVTYNVRFACIRSGGLEIQNFQQTQNLIRITKL